jgi:uncharacterized protein YraI
MPALPSTKILHPIRLALAGAAVSGATLGLGCLGVESAGAMSAPISITSTVNLRPGPNTSAAPIGSIPTGASPDFVCWTQGQNINGVDVWFNVNWAGRNGYYASYYDSSHYATDAQITSKYGIRNCSSTQPTPPPAGGSSAAANGAMSWARSKMGQNFDSGLCLSFVFSAYSAAGVNLRPWVNVPIGSNTYPVDIWGHFTHGTTGNGTPPAGSLVFWASKTGNRTLSHVTLSTGNGQMISTADSLGSNVHYETMAQRGYSIELGWWLPS